MAIDDVLKPGALRPSIDKTAGEERVDEAPLENTEKTWWQRRAPVIACGSGLFSDGYLNGVIGSVNTILGGLYPNAYANSNAQSNITSLVFVGEVLGIIIFGYTSDRYSRKWSIFASTVILFIFAALAAGSYGGGSAQGLLAALAAYRFLLGIGIGGEYPAGSVGCAESTGELKAGTRNRWFIWFTNLAIDAGFVVAAFVPMIVVLATGEDHLRAAWRIMLGLGVIPPLSLFYMRFKLKEPEAFVRNTMAKAGKAPWKLIIKRYWFRLAVVSTIWFIYDYSAYAFGTYSAPNVENVLGKDAPLWKTFGWNTVINFFYIPGAFIGSYVSDWIGPRKALAYGVTAQAVVGFIMAGCYPQLAKPENIGGFVVVYGIFLSLGELGPGDNIGLIASKTCATAVRARYYGFAAAFGKIGAFVGNYLYPILVADAGDNTVKGNQFPFWVASSLCCLSAVLAFFCLPEIGQDTIDFEDQTFKGYLLENGYDVSRMGLAGAAAPMGSDEEIGYTNEKVQKE